MIIAVFQFSSTENINQNFDAIKRAIVQASEKNVRLLVFHECSACGYPPIETPDICKIDFDTLSINIEEIQRLAKKFNMYIALGTIRRDCDSNYNSILLINDHGEIVGSYDKRALWGWDLDSFKKGSSLGVFEIDGVKIGFRICFEIRFPEYFRELFSSKVELCFVSFCDICDTDSVERYDIIKSHLRTRAVENVMTVVSANSISKFQTAPTAIFDINGKVVKEAPKNEEFLLVYDYVTPEIDFGANGRIQNTLQIVNWK